MEIEGKKTESKNKITKIEKLKKFGERKNLRK